MKIHKKIIIAFGITFSALSISQASISIPQEDEVYKALYACAVAEEKDESSIRKITEDLIRVDNQCLKDEIDARKSLISTKKKTRDTALKRIQINQEMRRIIRSLIDGVNNNSIDCSTTEGREISVRMLMDIYTKSMDAIINEFESDDDPVLSEIGSKMLRSLSDLTKKVVEDSLNEKDEL